MAELTKFLLGELIIQSKTTGIVLKRRNWTFICLQHHFHSFKVCLLLAILISRQLPLLQEAYNCTSHGCYRASDDSSSVPCSDDYQHVFQAAAFGIPEVSCQLGDLIGGGFSGRDWPLYTDDLPDMSSLLPSLSGLDIKHEALISQESPMELWASTCILNMILIFNYN